MDSGPGQQPAPDGSGERHDEPETGEFRATEPDPAQRYPGQPYWTQPYSEQPYSEQPYADRPYAGGQHPTEPYPGGPYPGQPYPTQPYPGWPPGEQTYPTQPYPGQPYSGQQTGYPPPPYYPYGAPPGQYQATPRRRRTVPLWISVAAAVAVLVVAAIVLFVVPGVLAPKKLSHSAVERTIEQQSRGQGDYTGVSCNGGHDIDLTVGKTFTCIADGGQQISVRIDSTSGHYTWQPVS